VANAAHEHGYVGEVWGALKGDRIRAMHRFFQGLSSVLNKTVAMQLVDAQNTVIELYRSSFGSHRHFSERDFLRVSRQDGRRSRLRLRGRP